MKCGASDNKEGQQVCFSQCKKWGHQDLGEIIQFVWCLLLSQYPQKIFRGCGLDSFSQQEHKCHFIVLQTAIPAVPHGGSQSSTEHISTVIRLAFIEDSAQLEDTANTHRHIHFSSFCYLLGEQFAGSNLSSLPDLSTSASFGEPWSAIIFQKKEKLTLTI